MAESEIKYTTTSVTGSPAHSVDLFVTYSGMPDAAGYYVVTLATDHMSTYTVLNSAGAVDHTDQITAIVLKTGNSGGDNRFNPTTQPYVDNLGIEFTIDNAADTFAANKGNVNFYYDNPGYGEYNSGNPGATAKNVTVSCFASGTLIRISRDSTEADVPVEDLRIGDLAVTASGEHRAIRWLGHRTMSCRNHPRPHEAMPVRISAQAFGADKPVRDLLISPGHAICVDVLGEVLIPASALINGTTVQQVEVEHVTYWHVELDSHDILLAENLPTESYLEMDNRAFFAESSIVGLDALPDAPARTHDDFCRPFHADDSLVGVVRAQLKRRALILGWTLDDGDRYGDLHLVVDGLRVDPIIDGLDAHFAVPIAAHDVRLVSTTARPSDIADRADNRELGLCIASLTIEDGFDARVIDLADPLLGIGFHPLEENARRWTAGRARLPVALWEDTRSDFVLRVKLANPALPRWVAPARLPMPSSAVRNAFARAQSRA